MISRDTISRDYQMSGHSINDKTPRVTIPRDATSRDTSHAIVSPDIVSRDMSRDVVSCDMTSYFCRRKRIKP